MIELTRWNHTKQLTSGDTFRVFKAWIPYEWTIAEHVNRRFAASAWVAITAIIIEISENIQRIVLLHFFASPLRLLVFLRLMMIESSFHCFLTLMQSYYEDLIASLWRKFFSFVSAVLSWLRFRRVFLSHHKFMFWLFLCHSKMFFTFRANILQSLANLKCFCHEKLFFPSSIDSTRTFVHFLISFFNLFLRKLFFFSWERSELFDERQLNKLKRSHVGNEENSFAVSSPRSQFFFFYVERDFSVIGEAGRAATTTTTTCCGIF